MSKPAKTQVTEMLNIITSGEHEHSYSVVINTRVSDHEQIAQAVAEALSLAELYEDDGDFTQKDVESCAEMVKDFSATDTDFYGEVCFWFDRPVKI